MSVVSREKALYWASLVARDEWFMTAPITNRNNENENSIKIGTYYYCVYCANRNDIAAGFWAGYMILRWLNFHYYFGEANSFPALQKLLDPSETIPRDINTPTPSQFPDCFAFIWYLSYKYPANRDKILPYIESSRAQMLEAIAIAHIDVHEENYRVDNLLNFRDTFIRLAATKLTQEQFLVEERKLQAHGSYIQLTQIEIAAKTGTNCSEAEKLLHDNEFYKALFVVGTDYFDSAAALDDVPITSAQSTAPTTEVVRQRARVVP
jgi:hypothetical protein